VALGEGGLAESLDVHEAGRETGGIEGEEWVRIRAQNEASTSAALVVSVGVEGETAAGSSANSATSSGVGSGAAVRSRVVSSCWRVQVWRVASGSDKPPAASWARSAGGRDATHSRYAVE
jgi:hypothetical protein